MTKAPENQTQASRPVCVVVDTNIWRKSLLLRTSLAPSLLYFLHQSSGKLGLPEVIEKEVHKQGLQVALDAVERIQRSIRELTALTGISRPYEPAHIVPAVTNRLLELDSVIVRVPITLEHVRAALDRVIADKPPNSSGNQQCKDSLIWEAIKELAGSYTVHFVTEDKGFYEGREYRRGMEASLAQECVADSSKVYLHPKLKDCLTILSAEAPPLDTSVLVSALDTVVKVEVIDVAAERKLAVASLLEYEISPFITERHDVISLDFRLVYEGQEFEAGYPETRSEIRIIATGNSLYSTTTGEPSYTELDRVAYVWVDEQGREQRQAVVYLGHVWSGRYEIPYTYKKGIDDQSED